MQLVDTSAWIEVFRRAAVVSLDDIVEDRDEVATCLPVVQEVLQGSTTNGRSGSQQEAMYALPCVDAPIARRSSTAPWTCTGAPDGQGSPSDRAPSA